MAPHSHRKTQGRAAADPDQAHPHRRDHLQRSQDERFETLAAALPHGAGQQAHHGGADHGTNQQCQRGGFGEFLENPAKHPLPIALRRRPPYGSPAEVAGCSSDGKATGILLFCPGGLLPRAATTTPFLRWPPLLLRIAALGVAFSLGLVLNACDGHRTNLQTRRRTPWICGC